MKTGGTAGQFTQLSAPENKTEHQIALMFQSP